MNGRVTPGRLADAVDALNENRTEAEAKAAMAARDRKSWFPAIHGSGHHGILAGSNGREVARFEKAEDRDQVIAMAKSHDAMRATLIGVQAVLDQEIEDRKHGGNAEDWRALGELSNQLHAAVELARGVKP